MSEHALHEAAVTINGQAIPLAQVMTLRVALTSFMSNLEDQGLGDDEHGQFMTKAYLGHGRALETLLLNETPLPTD